MAESSFRRRLLNLHPLDSPVVALAVQFSDAVTGQGSISAVDAVKFHGSREIGTLYVDDGAGIARLADFVGGCPVVAHGLAASLDDAEAPDAFLGGADVLWDTRELAELLLPESADDSVGQLAVRLGLVEADAEPIVRDSRAAVGDARTTRMVYQHLVERTRSLPVGVLRRLSDLLMSAHSPLVDLIIALSESPADAAPGAIGGIDPREIASRLERPRAIGQPRPGQLLDPDEISRLLAQDGPFARRFPRYEARPEQSEMSRAVAAAFGSSSADGQSHHLLVEGGTGIGKSVAYLLPAVLFAVRNNVRVVVSTNTINLQEQLVSKDIPDLVEVLADVPGLDLSKFSYTQLKGKANYLCLRRWEALANSETKSVDDSRMMAKTLAWLRETRTGDRAELRLGRAEMASWDRLSASGFSMCAGAREGACFYRHAREAAAAAHLLVVNHSLLLSDMEVGGSVLPEYDYLIVDEAHNLESEATRQFGFRVAQSAIEDMVERLGAIIHSLGNAVRMSALADERKESARLRMEEAQTPLFRVRDTWARLTADLGNFASVQRSSESDDGEVRITEAQRVQPAWSGLDIAWSEFERSAAEAHERADALAREMDDLPTEMVPGLEQFTGDIVEWLGDDAEARGKIEGFISAPDKQMVYWIGRGGNMTLNGAPLDVAGRLRDELFGRKQAVVLTSATLAVGGGFAHVRSRLGIEEPEEACLGSPFDYESAALLCLPTDVPDPNRDGYPDRVAHVIERLAELADGRTMALFTSHAAVRAAAARLRRTLPKRDISVLAQGVDGTPLQLLTRFQRHPRAVLLGTASFWEGVDVGNEALKVLVVARLPFNVPTEPIFAARSSQYEQAFMEYAVPQAVLRFRQGFGRLIRSKGDRGVVVVLDSRITSRSYGRSFLNSIPPATRVTGRFDELLPSVERWLVPRP